MTSLSALTCLFIDAQTSGPTPATGELIELAWCVGCADSLPSAVDGSLLRPAGTVSSRVLKLTGRTQTELEAFGVGEKAVASRLMAVVAGPPPPAAAVVHFARFEQPFLARLWQQHAGEPWPLPFLCTHAIARRLLPNLPSLSIRAVAGYLGHGMGQDKRARGHALATVHVWRELCRRLAADAGIHTLPELTAWLAVKAPKKSSVRAYPLGRDARLTVPEGPGVYRMVAGDGRVLYVGKATSLRSRVNSYFRQHRGHAPAKLELLAQVVGIETVPCATAVEAALIESDEIKRLDPPYNILLRVGRRCLGFYDAALRPVLASASWRYGPYGRSGQLEPLLAIAAALGWSGQVDQPAGLEPLLAGAAAPEAVELGLAQLAVEQGLRHGATPRALLARGIRLARLTARTGAAGGDGGDDPGEAVPPAEQTGLGSPLAILLSPQDICECLTNVLLAMGQAHLRARRVQRLLTADVAWRSPGAGDWRFLAVRGGRIVAAESLAVASGPLTWPAVADDGATLPGPGELDISTYDRMRVLAVELDRIARAGADVVVRAGIG